MSRHSKINSRMQLTCHSLGSHTPENLQKCSTWFHFSWFPFIGALIWSCEDGRLFFLALWWLPNSPSRARTQLYASALHVFIQCFRRFKEESLFGLMAPEGESTVLGRHSSRQQGQEAQRSHLSHTQKKRLTGKCIKLSTLKAHSWWCISSCKAACLKSS